MRYFFDTEFATSVNREIGYWCSLAMMLYWFIIAPLATDCINAPAELERPAGFASTPTKMSGSILPGLASRAWVVSNIIVPSNNWLVRASAPNSTARPPMRMRANSRLRRCRLNLLSSPLRICSWSIKNSPTQPISTTSSAMYSSRSQSGSNDQIDERLGIIMRGRHRQEIGLGLCSLVLFVLFIIRLVAFLRMP